MILYHYCSNHSFHSIINSRSIWLSALSLSNDTMEGKWLRTIFSNVCKAEKLDDRSTERIMKLLGFFDRLVDGLGFCLSECGDTLSQWRGYASDAAGVAIGFSKEYIDELQKQNRGPDECGFSLQKVVYSYDEQKEIVKPVFDKVKQYIDDGALKPSGLGLLMLANKEEMEKRNEKQQDALNKLSFTLLSLFPELYRLKNPAFDEEREWRVVSYFVYEQENGCGFRPVLDRLIPYRAFSIPETDKGPIREIILGPKNLTPPPVVDAFLQQHGFARVNVIRSEASYR